MDQMDIKIDIGFHHRNPNVHIPPSCVENPRNGRNTVVAFADEPTVDVYNVELASEDKIKEHLAQPRNWVPQHHKTFPEIPSNTAFICLPTDVPGHMKVHLQEKEISVHICQRFEELCEEYGQAFSKHNEHFGRTKLVKMDINMGDSPPVSSRP